MTSAAAPNRRALLIVPAFSGGGESARGALAQSDAVAYRDLLRLLGFSVNVIAADTRPTLDLAVREFASRVSHDAEVAVFILGTTIEVGTTLYVPASDLPAGARMRERIATEGLDVGEILRRMSQRGPRELVAIVDECGGGEASPSCPIGSQTIPDNVSAIVVHRVAGGGDQQPLGGVATVRQDLLPLMKEPDLAFLKLYARLKSRLEGTNDALATTSALSQNFAFLPLDFFEKLPTECNRRIDAGTSADALKTMPSLAPAVTACKSAADTWSFAPYFKDKLEVAREQLAFQQAMAGCDQDAMGTYLDRYPSGSYRFAVTDHKAECQPRTPPTPSRPPPEPPPPALGPSLSDRARAAVATFYERHALRGGAYDEQGLREIYAPQFDFYGGPMSNSKHLQDIRRLYTRYSDFVSRVTPGSLDESGCQDEASCLIRGSMVTSTRKSGESSFSTAFATFSVGFDLRYGIRVTYECAQVQGQRNRSCK